MKKKKNMQIKHGMYWNFRRSVSILQESLPAFGASEGQLRASALTYYTLFAIVPVFALVFGVAKGFELDEWLRNELSTRMSEHGDMLKWVYNFADTTLRETKGGLVAGIGALVLCWSVVKMIGNIESAFNRVWQVKKSRTIFRKFTDYLSFLVIAPVLLLAASSATMMAGGFLRDLSETNAFFSYGLVVIEFGLQCVPYLIVWILFSFIYIFLPNTRVRFSAALFGGVIAGSIYQLLQCGYIYVQMALSRYNVIYGSFSALPLFLIWMYLNWLIVLFGVTLSYLYQNFDYESKRARDHERTDAEKRLLALLASGWIARDFACGNPPPTLLDLSQRMEISATLTGEILFKLQQRKIIVSVINSEYDEAGYLPGLPLEKMTLAAVIERYDELLSDEERSAVFNAPQTRRAGETLKHLRESLTQSSANLPVAELVPEAAVADNDK